MSNVVVDEATEAASAARACAATPGRFAPYAELTKPGLTALVVATTAVGYTLGATGGVAWGRLLLAVTGTACVAGAANALNQWSEIRWDALMNRTCRRPLPSERLRPRAALAFGLSLAGVGLSLLVGCVNGVAAGLALATLLIYVLLYTPLKRRTTLCTVAGAVVGAIPPLIGWAAATGRCSAGGWVLFALLFVWQIPHFLAIAWLYRDEYARAGFRMLPVVDRSGTTTCGLVVVYALALLPVSAGVALVGLAGWWYLVSALAAGLVFVSLSVRLHRARTPATARAVFVASITYLPVLLILMVMDSSALC